MNAIITAAVVVRLHHAATVPCAACGNPCMDHTLRVLATADGAEGVSFYHEACAPDCFTTRAALARRIA